MLSMIFINILTSISAKLYDPWFWNARGSHHSPLARPLYEKGRAPAMVKT